MDFFARCRSSLRSVTRVFGLGPFLLSAGLLGAFGVTLRATGVLSFKVTAALRAPGDTVAVYGPVSMSTPNGNSTNYVAQFAVTVTPGQQYALQVVNGNANGTLRVTGGSVKLNGTTILTSAQLAAGGPGWSKVVVPLANDTLLVTVQGPAGAFLTISLLAYADPTFKVFGTERFTRTAGPPNQFDRTFTVPAGAGAPFQLCVLNGNPQWHQPAVQRRDHPQRRRSPEPERPEPAGGERHQDGEPGGGH